MSDEVQGDGGQIHRQKSQHFIKRVFYRSQFLKKKGGSDQYSSEENLPALSDVESVATDLSRRETETELENKEEDDEDSDGGVALEH
jgi:hypothetical protein